MKRYSTTLAVIVMVGSLGTSHADELRRNAWGFYAAPTTHHVSSGTDVEQMESSTTLGFGTFYSRLLPHDVILRAEVRWTTREFDANATTVVLPGAFYIVPTQEDFIEVPLILYATRTVSRGEAAVRISVGGGAYYAFLISQQFGYQSKLPDAVEPLDAGGYSRYGLLADGGVELVLDARNAVFLNFRAQDDLGISGEPEHAIAREDLSFGFYAGFEWLF